MGRYDHARFCAYCRMWISKEYARCPRCGNLLRGVPRNSPLKNSNRKYTLDEARQIFERFLRRGYTVEEAAEATLALTGVRLEKLEEVKTDA